MPMAEVFTISGAAAPASPAVQLQNALKALGNTNGDPNLTKLAVDGVIGPNTVKAVNYALATYIGGSPTFPRADLDVTKVRQYAGALAALVIQRVQKSGGSIPTPQVHAVARKSAFPAPVAVTAADLMPSSGFDRKWIWYGVGGVSVLIMLSLVASALKKKRK